MKRLKDIGGPGDLFIGFAVIRNSKLGIDRNKNYYLSFELIDGDSSIDAKMWNCSEKDAEIFVDEAFVKVKGVVKEHNGTSQLNIELIRLVEERDKVKIDDFIPRAPEPTDQLIDELESYLSSIKTPILKEIVSRLYNKHKKRYVVHVAASRNHHNYYSGLLYHVVSMMRQAKFLSMQYKMLNIDLLMAGIFCHDIGKLEEISNSFISPEYTRKQLLGHIVIGALWIDREVNVMKSEGRQITEDDEKLIEELMHLVLSHHGDVSYGYGSAVSPMTLEAKILHQIDKIDAEHEMIRAGLSDKKEGEFHNIWPIGKILKKSSLL